MIRWARCTARAISQARLPEQAGDHPRRRLAWMNLQQAKARWGAGAHAAGEACLYMAPDEPAARPGWLARSRAAFEQSMRPPLNGDHLINYRATGGKA